MSFTFIDTENKLLELRSNITSDIIAIDTEFIRTRNNEPILCLIQIALHNLQTTSQALTDR